MSLNQETGEKEWQVPFERQTFEHEGDMFSIKLEDGSLLRVSPEHKVYANVNYLDNSSTNSLVSSDLTLDCFFSNLSFDQIEQSSFNASATKSISSRNSVNSLSEKFSANFIASCNLSSYSSSLKNLTFFCSSVNIDDNSEEVICDFDNNSLEYLSNSSRAYEGDISSRASERINFLVNEPFLKNENKMLVSTTNFIYILPSDLSLSNRPLRDFASIEEMSLSVSSEFSSILSNSLNKSALLTFSANSPLITSDQFVSRTLSISFFNSSVIDIVKFGISLPPVSSVYPVNTAKVYKPFVNERFNLISVKDVYSSLLEGKEAYFLNSEGEKVKIESIEIENYNGKIYDVDVENDVVLVRRGDGNAFWSGNSNNGTVVGGNGTTVNGVYSRGMQFDGVNDYVSIPHNTLLNFERNNTFTGSAWFKLNNLNTNKVLFSKRAVDGADYYGYVFYVTSGNKLEVVLSNSNTNRLITTGSTTLSSGVWYHAIFVYNGSSTWDGVKIYLNGVRETEVNTQNALSATILNTHSFDIGDQPVLTLPMNGLLDEVQIYNRSLSSSEIQELYIKGRALWNYSAYQNLTGNASDTGSTNTFTISTATTNVLPSFKLMSDANKFYSPILPATTSSGGASGQVITENNTVVADTTAPVVTIVLPANTTYNSLPLYFNISLNENGTAWYSLNNGLLNYSMTGNESVNFGTMFNSTNSSIADGSYTFYAYANDTAGNTNYTTNVTFSLDNTNPLVTIINPLSATYNTSTITFNVTLNEAGRANFSIDNGVTNYSMTANASNTGFNYTLTSITDGSKTFNAYGYDNAGNLNNSVSRAFSVDTTNPWINFTGNTPANASSQTSTSIVVNVTSNGTLAGSSDSDHYVLTDFDNSLVGWWTMDRLNASGDVVDEMGKNNGSKFGNAQQNSSAGSGKFGKSFSFDGNGDSIIVPSNYVFTFGTGNFTSSQWVSFASTSGIPVIIATDTVGTAGNWIIYSNNGVLTFYVHGTGAVATYTWTGLTTNKWYNVLVSRSGTNLSMYVDNNVVASVTSGANLAQNGLNIGGYSGAWLNGHIEEVLIFNRSLSATEISALYNASANKYYNNFTGLATGVHTIKSYAVDSAGNMNNTETRSVTISAADTIPPVVTITLPQNTTYNSLPLYFNISLNENGTAWYSLNNGLLNYTMTGNESANFGRMFNATNSSIADGSYTFYAYANDTTGNNNYTSNVTFVVDRTNPSITSLVESPSDPATYSTNTVYQFNATVTDSALQAVRIEFNGVNYTTNNVAGNVYNLSITGLGVGAYNYYWRANDSVNNLNVTETQTYTINKANSEVNLTLNGTSAEGNMSILSGTSIVLNGTLITGDSGARLLLYNNGTLINNNTREVSNSTTFSNTGLYNITIVYVSSQNYSTSSETYYVNVTQADTTAPVVTINSPTNTTYNSLPLYFNISLNENGTAWYSLNNGLNNYTMTGNESVNFGTMFNSTNTSIADGSYVFYAYANDTSGNNNYTTNVTFSVDTVVPGVRIDLPAGNLTTNSVEFNVTLSESGGTVLLTLTNGTMNYTMTRFNNTYFNYTNA
ncbi:MAG: LamG-like jellyroll fold domain-containing protein, partial [Nanoarchaeota archaeon]